VAEYSHGGGSGSRHGLFVMRTVVMLSLYHFGYDV